MFDIVTATLLVNPQLSLIMSFCKLEGLTFEMSCDQRFVMTETKGHANPSTGFVVLTKDGEKLYDIYDVVHYVEERGLKRC